MLTPRENLIRYLKNEPFEWNPSSEDMVSFMPELIPDNVCRGFVMQQQPFTGSYGGTDLLGCQWEFEPLVGGSMEIGTLMDDIEDWEEKVVFPDLSAFDWEGTAQANKEMLTTDKLIRTTIFTGYFERLIAFIGFENSAMALVDEDQQEIVHKIFGKLTDLYIEMIRRFHDHFGVELVEVHDDWGTQRSPMFSLDTLEEMIATYVRRLVDFAHSIGVFVEIHSCGEMEALIPGLIDTGADMWRGQAINDKWMLVEKYGDRFHFGVEIRPDAPVDDATAAALTEEALTKWAGKNVWFAIGRPFSPAQRAAMSQAIRDHGKI